MDTPRLVTADAIAPMDPGLPPLIRNAGMVITGDRITAIGERSDLRREFGELPAEREHFSGVLLPGFVNAHTHLELSDLSAEDLRARHFTQWVSGMIARRPPPKAADRITREAFLAGLAQSRAAGVTTLGDISRSPAITRTAYVEAATVERVPRIVSFGEVMGLGKLRARAAITLGAAVTAQADAPAELHLGISPHAPYTVEGPTLRACVRAAIVKRLPVCMHLAELSEEQPFLADLSGPLGREWDVMLKLDIFDDAIPTYSGGPIRWAQLHGLLVPGPRELTVLLAHVNYCDHAELDQIAATTASVAYCPRTREYFGHDRVVPHRYRDMLDAGINVCLATDSLASNPDLSVLKEAQFVWRRDGISALLALEMITRRGATALGLGDEAGSLAQGKFADYLCMPMIPENEEGPEAFFGRILAAAPAPEAVYIGGTHVITL